MTRRTRLSIILITAALISLFAVPYHYRAPLTAALLTHITAEPFDIASIDNIDLGRVIKVEASGVASHQSEFDFEVGNIALGIGWFNSKPYLMDVVINNAIINVHPTANALPSNSPADIPALPRNYAFQNVSIHYQDDDQDWQAHVSQCNGIKKDKSSLIKLACRGELNNDEFSVNGDYGTKDDRGTAEPLNMDVRWGGFSLSASGYLDSLLSLEGADITIAAQAPNNRQIMALLGIHEVEEAPLSGTLKLTEANKQYILDVHLEMGDLQLNVEGNVANTQSESLLQSKLDLKFAVAGHSLFELGALFNEFRLQPEPFSGTGEISINYPGIKISALTLKSGETGQLNGDLSLPYYPSLREMHANIAGTQIRPTLITPLAEFCEPLNRPINFNASVTIANTTSQLLQADIISDHLSASVNGQMNPDAGSADLQINIERADIRPLGLCASIDLPNLDTSGEFRLNKAGQITVLSKIQLTSPASKVSGKVLINLEKELRYSLDLALDISDPTAFLTNLGLDLPNFVPRALEARLIGRGDRDHVTIDQLNANHLTNSLSLSGELTQLLTEPQYQLKVTAKGDNMREVFTDAEAVSEHPQPYSLSASVEGHLKQMTVHQLDLDIVQSHLSLSGKITLTKDLGGTQAKLKTHGKNLENLLGHWTDKPIPNVPFEVATQLVLDDEIIRVENLVADIGSHSITADLLIDRPPNLLRTRGDIQVRGSGTHELLNLLAIDLNILDRPYIASVSLEGTKDSIIVQSIDAEIGESDIAGNAIIRFDETPWVQAKLKSRSFYLPFISPNLAAEGASNATDTKPQSGVKPQTQAKTRANAATKLFSSDPLSLSASNMINADLDWEIDKVWVTKSYDTSMDLSFALRDGVLSSKRFNWHNNLSTGGVTLAIDASTPQLKIEASSRSARFPILWLLAGEVGEAKHTAFSGELNTQGGSVSELMANLDGTILYKDGQGRIQAGKLDGLFGDFFHNISSRITDRKKDSLTNINCTAGAIRIKKGVVSLKPGIVARTDRIDIFATGELNLATEQPNISLMTRPRTGLGVSPIKILAPRMKVTGTLAKPSFTVDATSSALSAGAAFFTGGMSVIASAVWDRITSSNEACEMLYEQALKLPEFTGHEATNKTETTPTVTPQNSGGTNQN